MSQFVDAVWVVATLFHAVLLLQVLPDVSFFGVLIGTITVVRCGRLCRDSSRILRITLPKPLVAVVAILVFVVYWHDVSEELLDVKMGFYQYMYMRFGFWCVLSMYATEVSQVLVPMFMMVRPFHCLFLVFTLLFACL